jgi:hypothetical protein
MYVYIINFVKLYLPTYFLRMRVYISSYSQLWAGEHYIALFDVGYDKGLRETGVGYVRLGFWRRSS